MKAIVNSISLNVGGKNALIERVSDDKVTVNGIDVEDEGDGLTEAILDQLTLALASDMDDAEDVDLTELFDTAFPS